MKNFLLALSLIAISVPALASNQAIQVSLLGNGTGSYYPAYQALLAKIGAFVASEKINKFILVSRGEEGGGIFCLELNPFNKDATLSGIEMDLTAIQPDSSLAHFAIQEA